jgi:hypothetical protein
VGKKRKGRGGSLGYAVEKRKEVEGWAGWGFAPMAYIGNNNPFFSKTLYNLQTDLNSIQIQTSTTPAHKKTKSTHQHRIKLCNNMRMQQRIYITPKLIFIICK